MTEYLKKWKYLCFLFTILNLSESVLLYNCIWFFLISSFSFLSQLAILFEKKTVVIDSLGNRSFFIECTSKKRKTKYQITKCGRKHLSIISYLLNSTQYVLYVTVDRLVYLVYFLYKSLSSHFQAKTIVLIIFCTKYKRFYKR